MCTYFLSIQPYLISGLIGTIASLAATKYYEFAISPKLDIVEDNTTSDEGNYPDKKWCSYHIKVRNIKGYWPFKVRRPAWNTRATIEVLNENGKSVIKDIISARWPKSPEPLARTIYNNEAVDMLDPSKLFIGRSTDVHYNDEQRLDIAIKFDGESDFYIFSSESYLHNWKKPEWKLGIGKHIVLVKVYYECGIKNCAFLLDNKGTGRRDMSIKKASITKDNIMKDKSFIYWLVRMFYFVFNSRKFIEIATEESIKSEFESNKQLAEAYPNKTLPYNKREEFRKGEEERTRLLRKSIAKSFLYLFYTISISFIFSFLIVRILKIYFSSTLLITIRFISASLIFWAVLGRLGWEIQTYAGDTLPEKINSLWYRLLYILGVFFVMFSYFVEVFKI
jgi:hypothetical protein